MLACMLGNYEEAERMGIEALTSARISGDSHACAWAYFALGNARSVFDLPEARSSLEEALELFRGVDDR